MTNEISINEDNMLLPIKKYILFQVHIMLATEIGDLNL